MSKFYIDYNPYLAKCIFKKNDRKLSEHNKIGCKENSRLQYLLSPIPSENWAGLAEEIANECNYGEIELYFRGRDIDFNDLKEHIEQYAGNAKFLLIAEQVHNDNDIETQLTKIFSEIKSKNIPEFNKKINGKDIFDIYEEAQNRVFDIGVIATMSSGKSTLINSLLHTELLPSKNAACTATITRILNKDVSSYEAECLGTDNKTVIHQKESVTLEKLREYNDDPNISFIDIEGRIPSIPNGKMTLRLCDTPGPNNSMNVNHRALTESFIENQNSIVLYILNACQLGTKDDHDLLDSIASQMKMKGKEARDRFIFVVNRCDDLDPGPIKGETYDKLYNDVISYLKTFDINNPTIVITSAYHALLLRKSMNNIDLSEKEDDDLETARKANKRPLRHAEKYIPMTPNVKSKLQNNLDKYISDGSTDLEALVHTGIPVLELVIAEYIEKYAYPIKIYDSVDNICKILKSLNTKTRFEKTLSESKELFEIIKGQINSAKKKQKDIQMILDDYSKQIDEIHFDYNLKDTFKENVIKELFDFTEEYNEKDKISKAKAISDVSKFQEHLMEYKKHVENELNIIIKEKIFDTCNLLFNSYSIKVRDILNCIEIDSYNFSENISFSSFKFDSVNNIISAHSEDVMETYYDYSDMKKNPRRKGFIGFFRFSEPWKIPTEKKRKIDEKIDIKNVCITLAGHLKAYLNRNIDNMCEKAELQTTEYKTIFKSNIHNLFNAIKEIIDQLEKDYVEYDLIKETVAQNEEIYNWYNSMQSILEDLFKFKEV